MHPRLTTYLIPLAFLLADCSNRSDPDNTNGEHTVVDHQHIREHQFDALNIPKSWTEISLVNNVWTYAIPCTRERTLQTIDLTDIDGETAVMWTWGTAGQWHAVTSISAQADSIYIETVLPYDTTAVVVFTLKYLDKDRNIVRWGASSTYCTYIPTQDTGKYRRLQLPCTENE